MTVDKMEAERSKRIPHHRRARRQMRQTLRKWDFEEWFRYLDFIASGEPKPKGWWTG